MRLTQPTINTLNSPTIIAYIIDKTCKTNPMKSLQDYTIVIHPDDNNTFVAYVHTIPGCHAWGKTSDEASGELVNVYDLAVTLRYEMIQKESNL